MNDETKSPLPITDPFKVPTIFINQVVGAGILNGVVNLTMACAQFTPDSDGGVAPDLVIASRLRMDLFCAQQLYETLGKQLAAAMSTTGAPN